MYEAGKLWERIEIMLASAVILVAERAWSWAYYDANLPHMKKIYFYSELPVVPRKAEAEVSKIGNL